MPASLQTCGDEILDRQRRGGEWFHEADPEAPAQVQACRNGDGAACHDLAADSFGHNARFDSDRCRVPVLERGCELGDGLSCLGLAFAAAFDDQGPARLQKACNAGSHLGCLWSAEPRLDRPPSCSDDRCETEALFAARVVASDQASALVPLLKPRCRTDERACARLINAIRPPMMLGAEGRRKTTEAVAEVVALCLGPRQSSCRAILDHPDPSDLLAEPAGDMLLHAMCELNDLEACVQLAMLSAVMLAQPSETPWQDLAERACRGGWPVACIALGSEEVERRGLPMLTCAARPKPCAVIVERTYGNRFAMGTRGRLPFFLDRVRDQVAEAPCDKLGHPTSCSALIGFQRPGERPEPTPENMRRLRTACPAGPNADGQGCGTLARVLEAQGAPAARVEALRKRACMDLEHGESCFDWGTAMLAAPDAQHKKRGVEILDRGCRLWSHNACRFLEKHFEAMGDETKRKLYSDLTSVIPSA